MERREASQSTAHGEGEPGPDQHQASERAERRGELPTEPERFAGVEKAHPAEEPLARAGVRVLAPPQLLSSDRMQGQVDGGEERPLVLRADLNRERLAQRDVELSRLVAPPPAAEAEGDLTPPRNALLRHSEQRLEAERFRRRFEVEPRRARRLSTAPGRAVELVRRP